MSRKKETRALVAQDIVGFLGKEVINTEALATAAKAVQPFVEAINKLVESVDEVKRSLADNKLAHKHCWDATASAIENALMFTNSVEQFAEWGHSADRIERVKVAIDRCDFRPLESFIATLHDHLEQTTQNFRLFQKTCGKAREEAYGTARKCQDDVAKTQSRKTTVSVAGATTSGLLLAGGITGTILTMLFPPAAGIAAVVGVVVTSAVAATGGIATAVATGRAVSTLAKLAKSMTKVAEMFEQLSESAATLLLSVEELNTWLERVKHSLNVTHTARKYAMTGYRADVIDAVECIRKESSTLYSAAQSASKVLNAVKVELRPCHGSPTEVKADRKA